jgi:alkyl hydroperoxide reductase subunit AhpC
MVEFRLRRWHCPFHGPVDFTPCVACEAEAFRRREREAREESIRQLAALEKQAIEPQTHEKDGTHDSTN